MKKRLLLFMVFWVAILLLGSGSNLQAQTTRYVKTVATGTGDGTSWADASANLQAMIDASASGDAVWVAAGTYKPAAYPTGCQGCSSNRDYAFYVKDGISIYGGFDGTETMLSQRNIAANTTTLSGDIGTIGDNTDNCYHVVLTFYGEVTIDGFTITDGNADGPIGSTLGSEFISQSVGGGIYTFAGTNTLSNNTVANNSAYGGGGIFSILGSNTLTNNTIANNSALYNGGGILTDRGTNTLTNNTVANNSAGDGGGLYFNEGTNTLTNNTVANNSALYNGGGISSNMSITTLTNNIFWGNQQNGSTTVTWADIFTPDLISVTYCLTQANSSYASGTGIINNQDPLFTDAANGDFTLQAGSPAIDAGTSSGAPATDLLGTARPQGSGVDMGAYEAAGSANPCTTLLTPSVTIASDDADNSITAGTSVTFTATPTNGGTTPTYQWKKNSNDVGTNSPTYTDATLADGDIITCVMTSSNPCASPTTATSNTITMTIATVTLISGTTTPACGTDGTISISIAPSVQLSAVRYVRVQMNKNDYLNLAELRAIEVGTGTNVALNKTVTAYSSLSGFSSGSLVDGDNNTFAHSGNSGTQEYLEVDLGAAYLLDRIEIVNRGDGNQDRADNLLLILKDASTNVVNSRQIDAYQGQNYGYTSTWNVTDVLWTDGATTLNRTGLAAGTYTLDYSDVNAVTAQETFTVDGLPTPTAFGLTGDGGSSCDGTGVVIGLQDSEIDVNYQLKRNGTDVGSPVAGTDAMIDFGTQTVSGIYTVVATHATSACTANMADSATITVENSLVTPSVTVVSDDADNSIITNTSVTFTATPTNGGNAPMYQWKKNSNDVGTNSPTYTDATLADGDVITCVMTSSNPCASPTTATSNTITMTVATVTLISGTTTPTCGTDGTISVSIAPSVQLSAVRYVRVQMNKNDYLNLAELRAIEVGTGNNVALNKTVTAYSSLSGFSSGSLVDGDNNTFAHSGNSGTQEYLEVDLGAVYLLDYIEIVNRGDGNQDRADNLLLILKDASMNVVNSRQIDAYQGQNYGYTSTWNVTDVLWTDGATTLNRTGLAGGNYTLDYSDVNAVTAQETFTVDGLPTPTAFGLTGDGASSCDGMGVVIGLQDSEIDVNYQLKRNGTDVGSPVAGTDAMIDFGTQTVSGIYTVVATHATSACTANMTGSATITVENSLVTPSVTVVSDDANNSIFINTSVTFTATPTNGGNAPMYQWKKNGNDVGTNSPTYTDATLADNDVITCVMTSSNPCASPTTATSNSVTMTVIDPCVGVTNRIYVTPNGTGNGSSWENATDDLQAAIDNTCGVTEIWVAAGTYKPTAYPTDCTGCSSNRDYAFYVKDGISIYGGFAGTEMQLSDRNIAANATILSGDIGTPNDNSDNCYHVVLIYFGGITIDGFTVTDGNADGNSNVRIVKPGLFETFEQNIGAGIYAERSSLTDPNTLTNNTVTNNNSVSDGGGIYIADGTDTLTNNTVTNNTSGRSGGGIHLSNGTSTLTNNTVTNNSAGFYGGGIYTRAGTNTLINNTVTNNNSVVNGGGIATRFGDNVLTNNMVTNNSSGNGGGIFTEYGNNTLINNTMANNSADNGGGLRTYQSAIMLSNNIVADNSAVYNGGGIFFEEGTNTATNNTVANNSAGSGGGIYENFSITTTLTNNIFWGNQENGSSSVAGADIRTPGDAVYVSYCLTQENSYYNSGTGIINNQDPLFTDAANGDFTLQTGSSAIDAGTSTGAPATDILGTARPQGNGVDMGAYESVVPCPVGRLYVAENGTGDGSSWANATGDLQAAIDNTCGITEIWVAAGTYKPAAYPTGCTGCSSNRDYAFYIKDGVSIYGGFDGTETMLSQRNIATNTTTLSGDIGTPNDNSDNCYHVVVTSSPSSGGGGVTIDGFTVTGGNADDSNYGTITLNGNDIDRFSGGGIYTYYGTNTLNNNMVSNNSTNEDGGGIYTRNGTNTLTNNTVANNSANVGGGIHTALGTNTLTNNTVANNSAGGGGGIFTNQGANTLINNTVANNSADEGGGIFTFFGTHTLINNTVTNNSAGGGAGGFYNPFGTHTLTNNIFWDNKIGGNNNVAGADIGNLNGTLTVTYCLTQANSDYASGTGIINNQDPLFTDAANGDFTLQAGSPAIDAGDDAAWTATGLTTDAAGNPRPVGVVDMGAYESSTPACNCDPACSPIPTTAGTYTATTTNVIGGVTHYCDGAGNLLLSLKVPAATTIPVGAVKIKIESGSATTVYPYRCGGTSLANSCFMGSTTGNVIINRFWNIDIAQVSGTAISTSNQLGVIFYFTDTDLNNLNNSLAGPPVLSPSILATNLRIYTPKVSYTSASQFPEPNMILPATGANIYNHGAAPSGSAWTLAVPSPQATIQAAEFKLNSVKHGGGIGKF